MWFKWINTDYSATVTYSIVYGKPLTGAAAFYHQVPPRSKRVTSLYLRNEYSFKAGRNRQNTDCTDPMRTPWITSLHPVTVTTDGLSQSEHTSGSNVKTSPLNEQKETTFSLLYCIVQQAAALLRLHWRCANVGDSNTKGSSSSSVNPTLRSTAAGFRLQTPTGDPLLWKETSGLQFVVTPRHGNPGKKQ